MSSVVETMNDPTPLLPNQRELAILDPNEGDIKLIWDSENEVEVEHARKTFDSMKTKGYAAYSVRGKAGEKGDVLTKFDPEAERIILAPRLVGG